MKKTKIILWCQIDFLIIYNFFVLTIFWSGANQRFCFRESMSVLDQNGKIQALGFLSWLCPLQVTQPITTLLIFKEMFYSLYYSFQTVYEEEICWLLTVTFGQKDPKLNSSTVDSLRLYSVFVYGSWNSNLKWYLTWRWASSNQSLSG